MTTSMIMIRFCFLLSLLVALSSAVKQQHQKFGGKIQTRQNNDKNNDKNNRDVPSMFPSSFPSIFPSDSPQPSPSPSATPTISFKPTIRGPTIMPTTPLPTAKPTVPPTPPPTSTPVVATPSPTASPTNPPTTMEPTTLSPTLRGSYGNVQMEFSSLNPVAQKDVEEALSVYLCSGVVVLIVDICGGEVTPESTVLEAPKVIVQVIEQTNEKDTTTTWEFTNWKVYYPVMNYAPNLVMEAYEMQQDPLVVLNDRIHRSWNLTDLSKRLDTPISLQGQEYAAFMATADNNILSADNNSTDDDYLDLWQPLEPILWSPMRILGISMLTVTTLLWIWVVRLSKQRRMEREWDAEFQERGKGGLVTEEGLDFMLAAGRHQESAVTDPNTPSTQRDQCAEEEESERRLPLPGYMNVEPATAYGFPQYAHEVDTDSSEVQTSSERSYVST
mmetsp:Transcript_27894/g.42515  ORF Transcript_27894/g.42515 Transcript_27894/m.42515 type:complete len:444 (+) Transcript_27894:203-1534(+)